MFIQALRNGYQALPPLARVTIGGVLGGSIAGAVVASLGREQALFEVIGFTALGVGAGMGRALHGERMYYGKTSSAVGSNVERLTTSTALNLFGGMTIGAYLTEYMEITKSRLGITSVIFPSWFATISVLATAGLAGFTHIVDPSGRSSAIANSIDPFHGVILGVALRSLGRQSAETIAWDGLYGCAVASFSSLVLAIRASREDFW